MPKKSSQPQFDLADAISLPEAARLADVSERHMRTLIEAGKVLGQKVGRNYLVNKHSAAAFKRHPTFGRPRDAAPQAKPKK